jgi:hypothetical protein
MRQSNKQSIGPLFMEARSLLPILSLLARIEVYPEAFLRASPRHPIDSSGLHCDVTIVRISIYDLMKVQPWKLGHCQFVTVGF